MFDTFYTTVATLCFALLGLWWVVVQFKYNEWMGNRGRRRMAYDISLYFLLPGIMSLIALLATDAKFLWRAAFVVAGIIGAVETLFMIVGRYPEMGSSGLMRAGRFVVLILYVLIALFAGIQDLPQRLNLALKPLEIEGIMISLMVFLGVNFVWVFFAEPTQTRAES